jgi:hypothetical protein
MPKKSGSLWVVVHVKSGIPASVEAFPNKAQAELRERELRKKINLDNDETGLFSIPQMEQE